MQNIFVVTLGTREIQFKKEELVNAGFLVKNNKIILNDNGNGVSMDVYENPAFPEFYCHSFPRLAGKIISENIDLFKPFIHFPLIDAAFNEIIRNNIIDKIVLVYTDQADLDVAKRKQKNNFDRDTVFYKVILAQIIRQKYPQTKDADFIDVAIESKVTDIDFQYKDFASKCKELFDNAENIENIFLLAQGGIDQINHALTLQLIQAFGDKVQLWQQAELREPKQLEFTNIFLKDLMKHQLCSLIDNGEYHGARMLAETNSFYKFVIPLLNFCHLRMHFMFKEADKVVNQLGKKTPYFIIDYKDRKVLPSEIFSELPNKDSIFVVAEKLIVAEFYFLKQNYTDFILALQIFFETVINKYLNELYCLDLDKRYQEEGHKLIEIFKFNKPDKYKELAERIGKNGNNNLSLSFPCLGLLALDTAYEKKHNSVLQVLQIIEHVNSMLNGSNGGNGLDTVRNKIAHEGLGADIDDLFLCSNERNKKDKLQPWIAYLMTIKENLNLADLNPFQDMNDYLKKYF